MAAGSETRCCYNNLYQNQRELIVDDPEAREQQLV